MSSLDFIRQVSSSNNTEVKETLERILSSKAFEGLEQKKQEVASKIFGGNSQNDSEEEEELEV